MKFKFCFIALAASLLQTAPALTNEELGREKLRGEMANEEAARQELAHLLAHPRGFELFAGKIGCGHKFSEEFAADTFKFLKDQRIIATGEITHIQGGVVSLKVLPQTFTVDVRIKMADARVAYDLNKGERLSIRFTLKTHGGCFLPFSGDGGEIVSAQQAPSTFIAPSGSGMILNPHFRGTGK